MKRLFPTLFLEAYRPLEALLNTRSQSTVQ